MIELKCRQQNSADRAQRQITLPFVRLVTGVPAGKTADWQTGITQMLQQQGNIDNLANV